MSFLDNLKEEASFTETLNGAKTHSTSGDACLDLFAVAGGMRHRSYRDQIHLFDRAYIENPELAMKLLFYIRDIREGLGERELFRNLIRHTAKTWPESARQNISLISEYGRFDDLMCLMGTPSEEAVVELIRTQLNQDCEALKKRKAGNINAHISLLAKWLPSINTSSARTRGQAKVLASALEMNAGQYRKLLSALRANIALPERYLTSKKRGKINYEAVPAGAMLKYHKTFHQQDTERFSAFLADVNNGRKSIHCDTLYPYEILRPLMPDGRSLPYREPDSANAALETLWKQQPSKVCEQNAICVIDVSGSNPTLFKTMRISAFEIRPFMSARISRFLKPVYCVRKPGVSIITPRLSGKSTSWPIFFPNTKIVPVVTGRNPQMHFIRTVFPEPLFPTIP